MNVKVQKRVKKEEGLLIVPFFKEYIKTFPKEYTDELKSLVKRALKKKEFEGKGNESQYYTIDAKALPEKVLFIGCGKKEKYDSKRARILGAEICAEAKEKKQQKVIVLLLEEMNLYIGELVESIVLKNYRISKYKTGEDFEKERKRDVKELVLITNKTEKAEKEAEKALIIARATNITKDLVNGPANIVNAEYFEKIAKEISRDYKVLVLNKDKLIKQGWGGLLSVNQGAYANPKCVIIEYHGGKRNSEPIVIVGKGIIFDSGGYNLKPTQNIEYMHSNKAGASAVIGIFMALKQLGIKQNVIGIMPLTENMIDGKAFRPSDIITMLNGKTVEITNTDAEGRLILGDGLTYGLKYKPKYLIDIATLTGAAMIALGDRYSALFANDKILKERLLDAGERTDDVLWELPLHKDHKEIMKSQVADLRNGDTGTSHLAGASKGAAFLVNFIDKSKWAHIDIAGTGYTKDPKKYEQMGATGAGVRLLLEFLEKL